MFQVRPETIDLLFKAQRPELRGQLRLDVASQRFPADVREEIDIDAAREAVGERLLRLLLGLANDAAMLKQFGGDWQVPNRVPKPDNQSRLRVMPDSEDFEPYVVARIGEQLGLDPRSKSHRGDALHALARDFYDWVVHPGHTAEVETYGITVAGQKAF